MESFGEKVIMCLSFAKFVILSTILLQFINLIQHLVFNVLLFSDVLMVIFACRL